MKTRRNDDLGVRVTQRIDATLVRMETWRAGNGYSIREAARRIGCAASTLTRWKQGHIPSVEVYLRVLFLIDGE